MNPLSDTPERERREGEIGWEKGAGTERGGGNSIKERVGTERGERKREGEREGTSDRE